MNFQDFIIPLLAFVLGWIINNAFAPYIKRRSENQADLQDSASINRIIEAIKSEFIAQNSYISEKNKNLADKEDLKELTHKVESVKIDFSKIIEMLKAELSKQVTVHKLATEKEFEATSEIGVALYRIQDATYSLRPMTEYRDSRETDEDRIERLYTDWAKKMDDYTDLLKKHRLFLPKVLHEHFQKIRRVAGAEGLDVRLSFRHGGNDTDAYMRSSEKMTELNNAINEAIDSIQTRFGIG